jgi:hypothetical protein
MTQINNNENQGANGASSRNDQEIALTIRTTQGVLTQDFDKNTLLNNVLETVKQKYGFAHDGKYELIRRSDNSVLELQRPIVSYGLQDGEELTFTDLGKAA